MSHDPKPAVNGVTYPTGTARVAGPRPQFCFHDSKVAVMVSSLDAVL